MTDTYRDRLASLPGLTAQPMVGTPECDRLEQELAFAIEDQGNSREQCGRVVLRFMIGRGYWPLGTTVKVTKRFKVKAKFPGIDHP